MLFDKKIKEHPADIFLNQLYIVACHTYIMHALWWSPFTVHSRRDAFSRQQHVVRVAPIMRTSSSVSEGCVDLDRRAVTP